MRDAPLSILAISQDFSRGNPSGSVLLRMLNTLADRHRITCLGTGPRPPEMAGAIRYIRVPRVRRCGLLVAFLTFHLTHRIALAWLRARGSRFDVVQTVDAESVAGNVVTYHFCSRAYLRLARERGFLRAAGWRGIPGVLQVWCLYQLRAVVERAVARSARTRAIICLSEGLRRDVVDCYQPTAPVSVIPNGW